jgi:tripartite-type tricarboxylate transporter receptor subunit TctC
MKQVKRNPQTIVGIRSLVVFLGVLCFSFLAAVSPASAAYPEKEITIIVPWAAGGGGDITTRAMADLMEKDLGKPVLVVNKLGGGGLVGFKEIASAKPDGYTIGMTSPSQILQKFSASSYLDWRELAPVAIQSEDPAAFTVNMDAPWKTVKEALDFAKANPLKMRIANSGPGAIWHVAAALLGSKFGIQFTHVPYSGGSTIAAALAGGHVEATTATPGEMATLVKGGKLRILAIASEKRNPIFPEVPTFRESGIDFVFGTWRCVVAPKNTPKEIIDRLERSVRKAVHDPKWNDFMMKAAFGQTYHGPEESAAIMAEDEKNYGKVIPTLGLKKN